LLLPPSKALKLKTSQLVACFRCPFSLTYIVASYGCCCSCCSCNTRVEKEEEEVATIQEHKKPINKRNPKIQSQENFVAFNIKQQRVVFSKIKLKRRKENIMYVNGGYYMRISFQPPFVHCIYMCVHFFLID
jgi:hypothetical protein